MNKKFVLFGILASILMVGSSGIFSIDYSFADDNLSVSKEDSEAYKKQLEKDEEKKKKAEEKREDLEEKRDEQKLKDEEKREELEEKSDKQKLKAEEKREELEEKSDKQKLKAEEKREELEEKRDEQKLKAEERKEEQLKKLEERKEKLESDRKKLEAKLLEKANKYEEELREIKEKYQSNVDSNFSDDVEKFSAPTAKLEEKHAKKSKEIREKLLEKTEKLDSRTQKILDKIDKGDYLGGKIGSSITSETYELAFDLVDATVINDKTQTSPLSGFMSFTTFDKGKSNLKLELQECEIAVGDITYNCGFGKARTTSSGDSGAKDSLVIIAFLEDNVLEEVHSTLKIFLNADTPISDIDDSSQVSILGPQSKISGMWFLNGTGTLTKSVLDDSTDDSTDNEISVELTEDVGISGN